MEEVVILEEAATAVKAHQEVVAAQTGHQVQDGPAIEVEAVIEDGPVIEVAETVTEAVMEIEVGGAMVVTEVVAAMVAIEVAGIVEGVHLVAFQEGRMKEEAQVEEALEATKKMHLDSMGI